MSKARPRTKRRKNKRHHPLSPLQKNEVLVLKEMGHTYPQICTKTHLGYGTVQDIIQKSKLDSAEIQKIRGEALIRAAQETFNKGITARDAISDADLVQERIEVHDAEGNLTDIKLRGPSPLQNATTFGILMDKAAQMRERGENLVDGGRPALDPSHLEGLLGSLGARITKLRVEVDVDGLQERFDAVQADYTVVEDEDSS